MARRTAIIGVIGYGRTHLALLLDGVERGDFEAVAAVVINPEEAEEECARLREAGCRIFADYQSMYLPIVWDLKRRIVAGEFGPLRTARAYALWPRADSYYKRNGWAGRLVVGDRPVYDSPLNNAVSHYLNLLLFFAGPGVGSSARATALEGKLYRVKPIESFDTASVRARLDTGATLFFHASHSCRNHRGPVLELDFDRARLTASYPGQFVLARGEGEEILGEWASDSLSRSDLVENLVRRINGLDAPWCGTGIASAHTSFIDLLHRTLVIEEAPVSPVEENLPDGRLLHLPGIEEALIDCFREDRILEW